MPDLTEAERELAEALAEFTDVSLELYADMDAEHSDRKAMMKFAATYELTRRQRAREEAEHERS